MRLFIAAELPQPLLEALAETSASLRSAVHGRYVATDSFHLTLAFLGNVEAGRINDLSDALDRACAQVEPCDVTLGGLGSFGQTKSVLLWQGFQPDQGQAQLESLAKKVRKELEASGFDVDTKRFLPHVTLMRSVKQADGILPPAVQASGTIDSVALFRSDVSGPRPIYTVLHRAELRD